jgi:hypothetical protein
LGEEWEKYFETLQRLPPRTAYVSHRIKGWMLPIQTATIEPGFKVLGMEEDRYYEWLATLPISRRFLVKREELVREDVTDPAQNSSETPTNGLRDEEWAFLVFICRKQ